MQIIQNLPHTPLGRRILRALAGLVGAVLTIAGLIATVPPLLFLVLSLLVLLMGDNPLSRLDADGLMGLLLCIAVAAVCLYLGRRLVRGKRRLVLFLRRFGFQSASKALTFAVSTALGRRWRLVTLDDAEIAPMGVPGGKRWAVGIGRWIFLSLFVIILIYALFWFFGDAPGRILDDIFNNIFNASKDRGDNPIGAFIVAIFGMIVAGFVILLVIVSIMLMWVSLAATASLFSWYTWREVRKAESSKALELKEAGRIEATVAYLARRANRIFAPRLAVLRVSGTFWQEVVRTLADTVDVIVVDISEPSENLLWEIETLKRLKDVRPVFVGQLNRIEQLKKGTNLSGSLAETGLRLRSLLTDEAVLVYESEDNKAMRYFAANLSARLETL